MVRVGELTGLDVRHVDIDIPALITLESDHAQRKAAARAFRPRRALPAIVLSALLAAATGLIAAYLISKYVGHQVHVLPSGLFKAGHQLHWDDQRSVVAAAVACVLGLLLIGLAVLPGRFRVVPVASQDPWSVAAATRAGLRRYLAGAATTVDGIASAKVRVRRRRARVYAASSLRDTVGRIGEAVRRLREALENDELNATIRIRTGRPAR